MGEPLSIVADAIVVHEDCHRLVDLLDHFWDQRRGAAEVLTGPFASRLVRALDKLIVERAPDLQRNDAIRIADTQIAFIRLWISGETPGPSSALAATLIASAHAQRTAFR